MSIRDLTKRYEGGGVAALDSVSLDVGRGVAVAVMGPCPCGIAVATP